MRRKSLKKKKSFRKRRGGGNWFTRYRPPVNQSSAVPNASAAVNQSSDDEFGAEIPTTFDIHPPIYDAPIYQNNVLGVIGNYAVENADTNLARLNLAGKDLIGDSELINKLYSNVKKLSTEFLKSTSIAMYDRINKPEDWFRTASKTENTEEVERWKWAKLWFVRKFTDLRDNNIFPIRFFNKAQMTLQIFILAWNGLRPGPNGQSIVEYESLLQKDGPVPIEGKKIYTAPWNDDDSKHYWTAIYITLKEYQEALKEWRREYQEALKEWRREYPYIKRREEMEKYTGHRH